MSIFASIISHTTTYRQLLKLHLEQKEAVERMKAHIEDLRILKVGTAEEVNKIEDQYINAILALVCSQKNEKMWKKACNLIMVKRALARKQSERRATLVVK